MKPEMEEKLRFLGRLKGKVDIEYEAEKRSKVRVERESKEMEEAWEDFRKEER